MSELIERARLLLEEAARRERARALERYHPSGPQAAFHESSAFIRMFLGSNGSGKTTALVAEAIAVALGREPWTGRLLAHPPRRVMLCVSNFTHSAGEDLLQVLDHFLPEDEIAGPPERMANGKPHKWRLRNRSSIKLMSYEQAPTEFEGAKWDFVGFNEPCPRSVFIPCLRGVSKSGGRMAFAMTPLGADAAWIYGELYDKWQKGDPEVFVVTADMEAGHSFMSPEAQEKFKSNLDPDEYEARVRGRFRHLQGRVYKQFDRSAHVVAGPDALDSVRRMVADPHVPKGCVCDPHDRRPFALAWYLVDADGRLVFFDEWPRDMHHKIRSCGLAVEDYARLIREIEAEHGITPVWRVLDPSYGVQRRVVSDESIRDSFDAHGLCFDTDVDNSLEQGHIAVKERLNAGSLLFMPNCHNLIYAMENYVWSDTGHEDAVPREKPSEYAKDMADVIRYATMSCPAYFDPTYQPTELSEDASL